MSATRTHTQADRAGQSSDDPSSASPPRRPVSQADITLCRAVFGVLPAAATPSHPVDQDERHAEGLSQSPSRLRRWIGGCRRNSGPQDPMLASITRSGDRRAVAKPWFPATLCMSLADCCDRLSLRIRRLPEAGWVRQFFKRVRQQIERAQARFMGPWMQ